MTTKLLITVLGSIFILASLPVGAVSITKTRLFLDSTSRMTDMGVYNSNSSTKTCDVSLKKVGLSGDALGLSQSLPPLPDPTPLVRLAPRKFDLGNNEHQAFKLIYRRKPGIEAGEYIGAIAIRCSDKEKNSNERISIKPQLVHNIPLVVRVGTLSVSGHFKEAQINGNKAKIYFSVQGNRSVTGDFKIMDKTSGELLVEKKKVSIYPQLAGKELLFNLPNANYASLEVVFKENKESGALTVRGDVTVL